MELETQLGPALERAIPSPVGAPAAAYLEHARGVRRRRRIAGATAAVVLAGLGGVGVAALTGGSGDSAQVANDTPSTPAAAEIPAWAQEFGNHGPASIYPDGRLWVAPDAEVIRTIELPVDSWRGSGATAAFAVEAEFEGARWWWFGYRVDGGVTGEMDEPGRWTTDLEIWADNVTSRFRGVPTIAERLGQFANDDTSRLVAGDGARIVSQTDHVPFGEGREDHPRRAAAEVVLDGQTWFLLAEGPKRGAPFYAAYEPGTVADDFAGFLAYLAEDVPTTSVGDLGE